jgi:hypothetical protein
MQINANFSIFFHGTSEEHAESILNKGIVPQWGAERQDFSHKDGFYLHEANNIELAIRWAKQRFENNSNGIACIVFTVNTDDLKSLDHLDMQNSTDLDWQERILLNRAGKNIATENFEFIRGFACSNPRNISKGEAPKTRKFPFIQVCLKRTKVVQLFQTSKVGVIYIEK